MSLHSTTIPIHSFLSASSSAESAGIKFQLNPYASQQEPFSKEPTFPSNAITGSQGYPPLNPKEETEDAFFQKAAVIMTAVRACQLEPLKKIQRQLKTKKLFPFRSLKEVVDPYNRNLFHVLAQATANPLIPKMAGYLLSQGVQPNQQDINSDTPIFMAAAHGNIPLITFLLDHQIDVNAPHKNTETPIFAAIRGKKTRAVEALIQGGAALEVSRLDGMTPLNLAVEQKNTEIAALLLKKGANPNIGIKFLPQKTTKNSLNSVPLPINPLKSPLWKAVTQNNAPMTKLLLDYGAYFNLEAPGPIGLLSQALIHSGPEVIQLLLKKGVNVNSVDDQGNSLLHKACQEQAIDILKILLSHHANPNIENTMGETPLEIACGAQDVESVKLLLDHGANPQIDSLGKPSPLYKLIGTHNLPPILDSLLQKLLNQENKNISLLKTLLAIAPISDKSSPDETILLNHLPHLLTTSPIDHSREIAATFERYFDHHPGKRGYHPNEAEMLLMLRHPNLLNRRSPDIGPFTTALTSLTRFIDTKTPLSDALVKAWGDIGFFTQGFRFWKFDVRGGENSLFSAFGFKAIENTPLDDVFGKGFWIPTSEATGMTHTKSDGFLLFRHGFIAISLPHHGTLFIRNSSPVFGRNLLKHPAYYLEKSLSVEELKDFDPRNIPENRHILHRNIVNNSPLEDPLSSVQKISGLSEALLEFKEHYRRFKFDSQAYEGYGNDRHFSGQLSLGLPVLLTYWLHQTPRSPVELAFVHPNYPIWKPFATFSFTPGNVQEIQEFITGTWTPTKYPNSPWIKFITQGGVENRAELVLIDAKNQV